MNTYKITFGQGTEDEMSLIEQGRDIFAVMCKLHSDGTFELDGITSITLHKRESRHHNLNESGTTSVPLSGIEPGDTVTLYTKSWIFLGYRADKKEAYFASTRPSKYACYARVLRGGIDVLGMTKMRATIEQIKKAHNLG